jgi:hypothetical protein
MFRFPNPGSTIENFLYVLKTIYLKRKGAYFTIDDMVKIVVHANLATSSGYSGEEAISRSTREDRSRDPLYNQMKMYSELFRMLGCIRSHPERALEFRFTKLGEVLATSSRNHKALFGECLVGIVVPTQNLRSNFEAELRPFPYILDVMERSQGYLSRDEIILGPLSATTDRDPLQTDDLVKTIASTRQDHKDAEDALKVHAKKRGVQVNTLRNYTRWPLAAMRYLGWVENHRASYTNGRHYQALKLTNHGVQVLSKLRSMLDIRWSDLQSKEANIVKALAILAYKQMLERCEIAEDVYQFSCLDADTMEHHDDLLLAAKTMQVLYSPFQTVGSDSNPLDTPPEKEKYLPHDLIVERQIKDYILSGDQVPDLQVEPKFQHAKKGEADYDSVLKHDMLKLLDSTTSTMEAARKFALAHAGDSKDHFYPLVANLFRAMGYDAECSRPGVNYQRWDARIQVDRQVIPVEIKSPTEEVFLSTKAVRQALENKIILMARVDQQSSREITSLVVGYRFPNERGEMAALINDVYKAYGLRIGVIDIQTLAFLAICALSKGDVLDKTQLQELMGLLYVQE